MQVGSCEDSVGEFQQLGDELVTYNYSSQMPLATDTNPLRSRKQESLRLETKSSDSRSLFEKAVVNLTRINKKVQGHLGKIIKVGSAIFKSNFESGSLGNVEQIGINAYRVSMDKEINSTRPSAWFYFSCQGLKGEVYFHLQGFTKTTSLYNQNMKVCYRDSKDVKWRRGGTKISYQQSSDESCYELRFTHFFKTNEYSCVEFAFSFPYGYKRLQDFVMHLDRKVRCGSLGQSFDGREIPLLTVGNPDSPKVIILSARVHPGEAVSSFIMEGFLKQLTSDNQFGNLLRSYFLFQIVPMLNPDGVVRGNYRFSTAGCDLNRKWKVCKQTGQPEIYFMRQLIRNMSKDRKVIMYIDIHGHSRKKNVFFYGCCESVDNPRAKQFPFLMEKIHEAYKYENCCFTVQKDKEGTARIAMWKQLKTDFVYTLECSMCGNENGANYLEADYEKIGRKLCEGMAIQLHDEVEIKQGLLDKAIEKMTKIKQKAIFQLKNSPTLLSVGTQEDSGSDSEPEKGEIQVEEKPVVITNTTTTNAWPSISFASFHSRVEKGDRQLVSNKRFIRSLTKNQSKVKKQPANAQQIRGLINAKQSELQRTVNQIQTGKANRPEIRILNNMNTYEVQSLKSSSLYQRTLRVHSLSRNLNQLKQHITSTFQDENDIEGKEREKEKKRFNIHLMRAQEGIQYRRVRKIAELSNRAEGETVDRSINNTTFSKGGKAIAPRFYPISQQKYRRTSVDVAYKKQLRASEMQGKRISINGDELNVRCLGLKIYF